MLVEFVWQLPMRMKIRDATFSQERVIEATLAVYREVLA